MVRVAIGLAAGAAVMLVIGLLTSIVPLIFVSIALSFSASIMLRFHLFRRRRSGP